MCIFLSKKVRVRIINVQRIIRLQKVKSPTYTQLCARACENNTKGVTQRARIARQRKAGSNTKSEARLTLCDTILASRYQRWRARTLAHIACPLLTYFDNYITFVDARGESDRTASRGVKPNNTLNSTQICQSCARCVLARDRRSLGDRTRRKSTYRKPSSSSSTYRHDAKHQAGDGATCDYRLENDPTTNRPPSCRIVVVVRRSATSSFSPSSPPRYPPADSEASALLT